MTMLAALAWVLNIWVVLTYFMLVHGKWSELRFNAANALGFIPTAILNIQAHVYPPLILTFTFGFVGIYGVVKHVIEEGAKS